ncbi:hypothetical protein [Pseudobacteriovorax antillogorgiicola]|uniref:Tetratricopeptide repeat-containing protein n=1 Tax=Pseudobacteriovorax antillogorgiicola TaxID=1513793 RepID=A0A1Y6CVK6_9BACT|nr:hypothetical protein [Pseudobacteriovorax antillogorgiicola]TCS42743.1 hypothetical protein EDD56_14011 [Pseudobacteriovorax antillogorgiicola]SMF82216.1 hypothetical protein SAMN06296036_14011 [Pseudobacteriovorax antillogorgiicola]
MFKKYIGDSWARHGQDPHGVAERLIHGVSLIKSEQDLIALLKISYHVTISHLKDLSQFEAVLESLQSHSEEHPDLRVAELSAKFSEAASLNMRPAEEQSQKSTAYKVSSYALASASFAHQGNWDEAKKHLELAKKYVDDGNAESEGLRDLAVSSNNIALDVESETSIPDPTATALMIDAALTARKYWEMIGSWLEVERAEYRLSASYLKAQNLDLARQAARNGISICENNGTDPLELFFAYEALAKVENTAQQLSAYAEAVTRMEEMFELIGPDNQPWCQSILESIKELG